MVYAFALAALLSTTLLQTAAKLPPLWFWLLLAAGSALLIRWCPPHCRRTLWAAVLGACLLGAWAQWQSSARLQAQLARSAENQPLSFRAVLIDIPEHSAERTRVTARLLEPVGGLPAGTQLLLSDHAPPPKRLRVHAGERWQFIARLKRPHGLLNPGGQDREAWLWAHDIRATGSIRSGRRLAKDEHLAARLAAVREHISTTIQQRLPRGCCAGLMAALVVGDASAIPREQWTLFAATGVTHLVSISGLHITLVAGQAAALAALLWGHLPGAPLLLPTRRAAAAVAVIAALAYALLAGFSVPTQRTLFMLIIVAVQVFWRQQSLLQSLALSLIIVLVRDPFAVLTPGLWLSFTAVAVMALGAHGQLGQRPLLHEWGRAQWAVTLGLMPGLIALFGLFPWTSPLANLIAIPLISAVVTPLALIGSVCPWDQPLLLADRLAAALLPFLRSCASFGQWSQAPPPLHLWLLAMAGAVYAIAPRGLPGRWLGLVCLLPMLLWGINGPPPAAWRARVFDVGQGLAILVQTQHAALLYDTGPDWPGDGDSGSITLLPALRALDIRRLSLLIVSHNDNDHSGGAASIVQQMAPPHLLANLPVGNELWYLHQGRKTGCMAGQKWRWDNVDFEVFNPLPDLAADNDNDGSCVVRVSSRYGSLLLSGDIGARREHELMLRWGTRLRSDIVLAPHHGSKASSSSAFLESTAPDVVIFSAGYFNRFRHPHPDTLSRYADIRQYRTDLDGAIGITATEKGLQLETERSLRPRFWRDGTGLQIHRHRDAVAATGVFHGVKADHAGH